SRSACPATRTAPIPAEVADTRPPAAGRQRRTSPLPLRRQTPPGTHRHLRVGVMIDLTLPGDALTASLVDVPSVSGSEVRLADEVETALKAVNHLVIERDGDAVLARTDLGRPQRVVIAGHLDP